jgi:hypothetical protein
MNLAPLLVFLGVALFALLALLGDRQFSHQERLPVRWGRGAEPDTYIARRAGLAFFPVIGTLTLLLLCRQQVYIIAVALLILATANLSYFRAIARKLENA